MKKDSAANGQKHIVGADAPVESLDTGVIASKRELTGVFLGIAMAIGLFLAIYQLYCANFGSQSTIVLRAWHWTCLSALVFLLYPALKKRANWKRPTAIDCILCVAAIVVGLYVLLNWQAVAARAGFTIPRDVAFGVIATLIVLEATRRVVGWPLVIVCLIFILYSYFGYMIPGGLAHKGYGTEALMRTLYISTNGIFGTALGISASYVMLFIMFGAVLNACGGGELFTDLAFGLVGKKPGGPAKAAVVSSALMGMISGAAVANVVTTGTFTIPLMKKSGYSPTTAGAIESVASSGGQIMPPVMGAGAFIMAEYVGVPYARIMLAAMIPAILYYVYVYLYVGIEAKKFNIVGLQEGQYSARRALKERGHLLIPLIVLIVLMCVGYSPAKSVFWCIILIIVVAMLRKNTRPSLKTVAVALFTGVRNCISVATACAAAGIITGVISLTGIGLRFSSIMIEFAGGSLLALLVLTMLASIVLGMGLPTSAAYVILAVLTAPALEGMGVSLLAAHFFIFYFGCFSTITPPVALSAYAAAGISGASPMKTGYKAFVIGIVAFIIPFMAVYNPVLLLESSSAGEIILAVITSLVGVTFLTYAMTGFFRGRLHLLTRFLFAIGALGMMTPGLDSDLIGMAVIAAAILLEKFVFRNIDKHKPNSAAA